MVVAASDLVGRDRDLVRGGWGDSSSEMREGGYRGDGMRLYLGGRGGEGD